MGLCFAARTDIGRRRQANEDFFAVDEARRVLAVADGLGGHAAGRNASEIGTFRFMEAVRAVGVPSPLEQVRLAFREAHEAIVDHARQDPSLAGMGTTLVAVWLRDGIATLGHVGDSRIYLLREEHLHPLTFDHSLVSEMVFRGRLSPDAARTHPHRHVITRALGVGAIPEPDTAELRSEPGDLFVLCTDGVTAQISDAELREIVLTSKDDLALAAHSLIELANQRGGEDNATVVLGTATG